MTLIGLSWKNLVSKPLNLLLSLVLFGLGVGLITLLLLLNTQLDSTFKKNLAGVDVVLGAKGSSMQIILCNMYHIDNPTGNISLKTAAPFLNPNHPFVSLSVPLSLGDSYRNYRIVGTLHEFIDSIYKVKVDRGRKWEKPMEVTIGHAVAKELNMQIGDLFFSSHGLADDGMHIHDETDPFVVVGVLEKSGSAIDQLILTSSRSIWAVHQHGNAHHKQDSQHLNEIPGLAINDREILMNAPEEDITSILIRFKNNKSIPALNFTRNINENTDMMAASPAYERARLSTMMGSGEQALRALALAIVIVSALSVFISLLNALRERKYELALIRVMGAPRKTLFLLITLEGMLVALLGAIAGIIIGHIGMEVLGISMENNYRYSFTGLLFLAEEFLILGAALIIGFLAALIPAFQAYKTQIAYTLTDA